MNLRRWQFARRYSPGRPRQVQRCRCDGLHGTREPFHLAALLRAGRRDMKRDRWPSVSTAMWIFESFLRFPRSWPAGSPLSGVERNVRLPKHPAASQRCVCWYTAAQRGRSFGIHRRAAPVFTI